MAFVGFARVSAAKQDLTHQIDSLKKAGCKKIFQGKHSGKADANKRALAELLDYVRAGDVVLVTKLDRLGRSLSQVLQIIEQLAAEGVHVRALEQSIDTSKDDPISRATVQLFGMFAEMERGFIVSRTSEGKAAKIAAGDAGAVGGRPQIEADKRQEVERLLNGGTSQSQAAKITGVSRRTVGRIFEQINQKKEQKNEKLRYGRNH